MSDKKLYIGFDDPQFANPYIDVDEWRNEPVRHHYIHGGFEGTLTKFCFHQRKPMKKGFSILYRHLWVMRRKHSNRQGWKIRSHLR